MGEAMTPVHFSTLKEMRRSPAHAKYAMERGDGEETASTRIGSASHSIALGTGRRVVTYEGRRDKRTEAYRNFLEENQDALILSASEFATASSIGRALRQHDEAIDYLQGDREQPQSWTYLGRACATRGIDVIDSAHIPPRFITELKTTKFAKPEWFQTEVLRRAYHCQLVHYEGALGVDIPELVIVAVESAPPHPVVVYRLSDRLREQAAKQLRLWMEQFLVCEQSNHWPGYTQSIVELDVRDDAELDFSDLEEVA